mgnify:CR=1 FL=1
MQQQHSGDSHSGGTWQSADTAFGGAPPAPRSKAPASATQQSPKCQEEGTEGSMGEEELQRATAAYDAGKAEAHKQKVGVFAGCGCAVNSCSSSLQVATGRPLT